MSWATRGGRRYYYQAVKVNGQAKNIYLGVGPEAEQAAAQVAQRRQERTRSRSELQADQRRHVDSLQPYLALTQQLDILFRATLQANGYHQHARGPWRKRKAQKDPQAFVYPDTQLSLVKPLDLETHP